MWEVFRSWRKSKDAEMPPVGVESPGHMSSRTFSVNFKDLKISNESDLDQEEIEDSSTPLGAEKRNKLERNKLIIIMVGLPGRGKTFLCNKLVCYLNWLGHDTKLFNVGSYRRQQKDAHEVQDAAFFDKNNMHGLEARRRALEAALADLEAYLNSDVGQVAIFDATNTTNDRRQQLIDRFHGKYQYLFIESICNDPQVLEQNYRSKMRYSPDYKGVDEAQALNDFKERIRKYEEVYEPLEDRTRHYIKLIDMVTGRGHMDINRISGYIPGKIVFFLMQVCKAGMNQQRKIWLTRHGESLFNQQGKIGGNSGLSELGEEYASKLPGVLMDRLPMTFDDEAIPLSVWTSTLRRTIATADYLMFPKLRWKALDEIHAGSCDGMTYEEIHQRYPEEFEQRSKNKLRYRYPAGESYLDVIQRLEPVIIELEREKECVCIVGHQAVLRAVLGYFAATPLNDIPNLSVPLHTLIELQPRPDGTMQIQFLPVMSCPKNGRLSVPPPPEVTAIALHQAVPDDQDDVDDENQDDVDNTSGKHTTLPPVSTSNSVLSAQIPTPTGSSSGGSPGLSRLGIMSSAAQPFDVGNTLSSVPEVGSLGSTESLPSRVPSTLTIPSASGSRTTSIVREQTTQSSGNSAALANPAEVADDIEL